jgi:PAS domain S-box-containing protein
VLASAERIRVLTDAAPIGIFQTDAQNRYVYTNPRWCEISGTPAGTAAGQRWDVIIDERQRAALAPEADDTAAGRREFSHRFEIVLPDGSARVVQVNSKPMLDKAGEVTGWVGSLADITAGAEAEAALTAARDDAAAASRMKSDFLANMSHEIRTPMNGVLGMTGLLLETDLDEHQRDYAETVRNSGDALLTVINDILDFSKIETGMVELEHVAFSIKTVVNDVVNLLRGLAVDKGLELKTAVDDDLPPLVNGDPGRLRQVLTNLVGNAIKFSQAGDITVRAIAGTAGSDIVRFEVIDAGDGIPHRKLEAIFEEFVQADASTTRKNGGTGLGLAISRHLVGLMGGEIGVSSRVGTGSTFWFTLSAGAAADAAVPVTAALGAHTAGVTDTIGGDGRLRVLLAEDNLINRKVAVAMLSTAGFRVDTVVTGTEAVAASRSGHYDAILMDCQMPEMNGYEATAAIRAREGAGRHTPIIALTASARPEDRERCLAAGMDFYLSKPISKDTMTEMLQTAALGSGPAPS